MDSQRKKQKKKLSLPWATSTPSLETLSAAIGELQTTAKLAERTAEAQKRGSQQLNKWAHDGNNAAIEDVMRHTADLMHVFADKQKEFARDYERNLMQLQKMADAERRVLEAERRVQTLVDKEAKMNKELREGWRFWRKGGDECLLRNELRKVGQERLLAEKNLHDLRAEMEVVKMFHFRHGMQGMADAYRTLAQSCTAIFGCQREITEMVPAISTQDVRRLVYDGSDITRRRVLQLQDELGLNLTNSPANRRSEPVLPLPPSSSTADQHHRHGTPPPPYTPSAPPSAQHPHSLSTGAIPSTRLYPELPPNPYLRPLKSVTP